MGQHHTGAKCMVLQSFSGVNPLGKPNRAALGVTTVWVLGRTFGCFPLKDILTDWGFYNHCCWAR